MSRCRALSVTFRSDVPPAPSPTQIAKALGFLVPASTATSPLPHPTSHSPRVIEHAASTPAQRIGAYRQPLFRCMSDPNTQTMTASSTTAAPRFVRLKDVAEVLNISTTQTYALVRSGELPAIKVGGRGQWRIELSVLDDFIQQMYAETKTFVAAHPFGASSDVVEN